MKIILLFFICWCVCVCLHAQPGIIDSSFGQEGKVISSFESYSSAESVLIEQDQKIIVVGKCSSGGIVVRYNTDGSIDSSFGINGFFITNELQAGLKVTGVLDKNEKIVLAGTYNNELRTIRLLNNGQIDQSFGKNGIASIINTKGFAVVNIAIQIDDKITVAANNYYYGIVAARWLSSGIPDSSFGTAAISVAVTSEDYGSTAANAIAITPENKIVVAGALRGEYTSFITVRFLYNGFLDTSFNETGVIIDPLNEYESIFYPEGVYSCAIQPDGKTIVAGTSTLNSLYGIGFVLIRYNVDGSPDKSFAAGGALQLNVNNGPSALNAIVLQKDGKILAAGAQGSNFLLTRFTSFGFTDTTFGVTNYTTSTDFGNDEAPNAIALQANGKIVLAGGSSINIGVNDIAIARYNNDLSKKQIIINKIKHYISNHNNANTIERSKLHSISIYPNPTKSILHINGLDEGKQYDIKITNQNGVIITSTQLNKNTSYNLNVENLSSGLYYISITSNQTAVTKKFVKE